MRRASRGPPRRTPGSPGRPRARPVEVATGRPSSSIRSRERGSAAVVQTAPGRFRSRDRPGPTSVGLRRSPAPVRLRPVQGRPAAAGAGRGTRAEQCLSGRAVERPGECECERGRDAEDEYEERSRHRETSALSSQNRIGESLRSEGRTRTPRLARDLRERDVRQPLARAFGQLRIDQRELGTQLGVKAGRATVAVSLPDTRNAIGGRRGDGCDQRS